MPFKHWIPSTDQIATHAQETSVLHGICWLVGLRGYGRVGQQGQSGRVFGWHSDH